jgi:phospholipase D1/2
MSDSIDGNRGEQYINKKKFRRKKSKDILDQDSGDEVEEEKTDAKRKFEAKRHESDSKDPLSSDSVAKSAMLNQPNLADESWQGSEQDEVNLWVREELYVHGRLLIVDDKTVICRSSNINDCSQLGVRDSELSIVMTDTKTLLSKMASKDYEAGYHAATLRRYLWQEHLGLLPPQDLDASKDINAQPPEDGPNNPREDQTYDLVADPLSDEVWEMWTSSATKIPSSLKSCFTLIQRTAVSVLQVLQSPILCPLPHKFRLTNS